MSTQTLTRTISVWHFGTAPVVTLRRWIDSNHPISTKVLCTDRWSDKQMNRIGTLSMFADCTSVMIFRDGMIVTSSYWKEVKCI